MSDEVLFAYVLHGYIPDRKLLPNNVTSARSNDRRRRQQRKDVGTLLKVQPSPPDGLPDRLWCRFTIKWPREKTINSKGQLFWRFKAFPDESNLNAALKGALDAVQDKIGVDDRYIHLLPPVQDRDHYGEGYTMIEIGIRDE